MKQQGRNEPFFNNELNDRKNTTTEAAATSGAHLGANENLKIPPITHPGGNLKGLTRGWMLIHIVLAQFGQIQERGSE